MNVSVFDLFSIGIGPSSSHTVGPMRAAKQFVERILHKYTLNQVALIKIEVFGSLAFTGKGHGTDRAILMGLQGYSPDTILQEIIDPTLQEINTKGALVLLRQHTIPFNYDRDFIYNFKDLLPLHTNGMRFTALDERGGTIDSHHYYSIGGGFVVEENETRPQLENETAHTPYPFDTGKTLLALCESQQKTIEELMLANEKVWRTDEQIQMQLLHIAKVMEECIEKGCQNGGILPGGLNIKRRAPLLFQKLQKKGKPTHEQTDSMEWLNLYAIAVNEENAAGGRVVTAPTNGAAGIIPAVLYYYLNFYAKATPKKDIVTFLLTAGAIAILYKKGASLSGAEVGCQGEVGVACSMAAGALTALLGGNCYQIENAAEIAMEHHLGMTCDPINGLVQIPCIERNAMGAVKAVNAARLALLGDGEHYVSLDKVIATMKQTGRDMMSIYKETSLGGLAANLPEC